MRALWLILGLFSAIFGTNSAVLADEDTRPLAVFVGSSSIAMWTTLEQDFPSFRTINLGVNGSAARTSGQLLPAARVVIERDVIPLHPAVVVIYTGENDLWVGEKPLQVASTIASIVRFISGELPDARIVIISIKPSPERWGIIDPESFLFANRLLKSYAEEYASYRYANVRFADVFNPMIGEDGQPREDLFVDRLHLNSLGYAIWAKVVTEALK